MDIMRIRFFAIYLLLIHMCKFVLLVISNSELSS